MFSVRARPASDFVLPAARREKCWLDVEREEGRGRRRKERIERKAESLEDSVGSLLEAEP